MQIVLKSCLNTRSLQIVQLWKCCYHVSWSSARCKLQQHHKCHQHQCC